MVIEMENNNNIKNITVNLNTLCKRAFYYPTVEMNEPLYRNVDTYGGDDKINMDKMSAKYRNTIKSRYNSPDNVRRLFIKKDKIVVEFYKPIRGDKNNSLVRELEWCRMKAVKGKMIKVSTDMEAIINSTTGQLAKMSGKNISKEQLASLGNGVIYRVEGNPFKALTSPYVLQNIEEMYFDESVFTSSELLNSPLSDTIIKLFANKGKSLGVMKDSKEIQYIIDNFIANNKDVRKQFPRLKAVGYIENLAELYKRVKYKPGTNSIEDMQITWVQLALKQFGGNIGTVMLKAVDGVPKLNEYFSVKSGIYQFDKEVLEPYNQSLNDRIKKYRDSKKQEAQEVKKQEAQEVMENEPSAVEQVLDDIWDLLNGDTEEVKKQVRALFMGRGKNEVENEKKMLSNRGKERYGSYF